MDASKLLRLNWRDIAQGAFLAAAIVVLEFVLTVFKTSGLDFSEVEWGALRDLVFKAVGGFLSLKLFSDNQGKLGGVI